MSSNVVENYGWNTAEAPQSCGYIGPKVITLLKTLPNIHRVLDLGSGNGQLCRELHRQGWQSAGVEYDKQGVQLARQQFPDIAFYNFGVQDDPQLLLASEPVFDAVVSTEVIEHLFSPHLMPQYAAQILKPGGYMVISTPYHGYLKNLALCIFDKWDKHHDPLWHGGHIKFWSRMSLTRLLEQNGFKVLEFHGVGRMPYLWKSMLLVAQKI